MSFPENSDFTKLFCSRLNEARSQNDATDVTIRCEKKEFHVHKFILSIGSSYFRNFFNDSSLSVIEIPDFKHDIVKFILDFLYLNLSNECIFKLRNDKIVDLLQAAHFCEISDLKKLCWQKLLNDMDEKLYSIVWRVALAYENHEVIDKVMEFALNNFFNIMMDESFNELSFSQVDNLLKKLERLKIPLQSFVIEGLIRWVCYDENKRRCHLQNFIVHLDIPTLPKNDLDRLLKSEPLFNDEGIMFIIRKKLSERSIFHFPEEQTLLQSYQLLRFFKRDNNFYKSIDLLSGKETGKQLPFVLSKGMSCAQDKEFIYFMGGKLMDDSPYSKTFIKYHLETNTSEYLDPIPKPVSNAFICIVNSVIYVVGGTKISQENKAVCELIQYYDLGTKKWNETTFPNKIMEVKLCADFNSILYILCKKNENCFQFYKINDKMKCTFECEMPYCFSLSAKLSAVADGCLFSLVEQDKETLICIYCSNTKQWFTHHFKGSLPEFVYCVKKTGNEFCIICLFKSEIFSINSTEKEMKHLMINLIGKVGFYDVPDTFNNVCLNFGYLKNCPNKMDKNENRSQET